MEDTTIAGILRDAAVTAADTVALVAGVADRAARRRWTYAELCDEADRTARALAGRFRPGERLAVCAPSLPESLTVTYAAAMARLVLVPLNPALRPHELAYALRQSNAAGVVHAVEHRGADLSAVVAGLRRDLPGLRETVSFDLEEWEAFRSSSGGPLPDPPAPDDVAQLVYTSGTTGVPKGALLTHRGMTNAARFAALRFGMVAGDVYAMTMPLYHVGGQVVSLQLCQQRATNVLVPAFDAGLHLELIETFRATLTAGVPSMLVALLDHPDLAGQDLSSLRSFSSGGAVVPAELVRQVESRLGARMTIVFGQTEASGFISQTHLDDDAVDKAETLGPPLPNVEVRVVDPETGRSVPPGSVGELQVKGCNVMAGYHDMPEATAETLLEGGWLRTGDLVTADERGYLRIVGRLKEMIVTGGENVFPVEVEAAIGAHPDVSQVAVFGVPDRRWGEMVAAALVPVAGSRLDLADVETFTRRRLAGFKVPKRWSVVEELPTTVTGKVQKFLLQERG